MQRTRIKICGVRDVETAAAVAEAGADAIGLVFVEKSPRYVKTIEAAKIVSALPPFVDAIGLFCNHSAKKIRQICDGVGLCSAQLHGHEPVDILDDLCGLRILRALHFGSTVTENAAAWSDHHAVHGLLIDTPPRADAELTGGSGEAFAWDELAAMMPRFTKPLVLAGGLTSDNVGRAIRHVRPYAVDVSSGVESARGVKDIEQVKAFCDAVRDADAELY